MESSRFLLNCMAAVVGIFGVLVGLGAIAIVAMGVSGPGSGGPIGVNSSLIAFAILYCALVSYLLWTVWKYVRRPSLKSATSLASSFSFALAMLLLGILGRSVSKPSPRPEDSMPTMALYLVALIAVWLFYRFVLKPVAVRAFPVESNSPPPVPTT